MNDMPPGLRLPKLLDNITDQTQQGINSVSPKPQPNPTQEVPDPLSVMQGLMIKGLEGMTSPIPEVQNMASRYLEHVNKQLDAGRVFNYNTGHVEDIPDWFNNNARKVLSNKGYVQEDGTWGPQTGAQETEARQTGLNRVATLPSDIAQSNAEAQGKLYVAQNEPRLVGVGDKLTNRKSLGLPNPANAAAGVPVGTIPTDVPSTISSQKPGLQSGTSPVPSSQGAAAQGSGNTGVHGSSQPDIYNTPAEAEMEKDFGQFSSHLAQNNQAIRNLQIAAQAASHMDLTLGTLTPEMAQAKGYLISLGADPNKLTNDKAGYDEATKALTKAQADAAHLISSRGTNLDLKVGGNMIPTLSNQPNAFVHNINANIGALMYQNGVMKDMQNHRNIQGQSLDKYDVSKFDTTHPISDFEGYAGMMYPFLKGEQVGNRGEPVPSGISVSPDDIKTLRAHPDTLNLFEQKYGPNTGRAVLYGTTQK